MYEHGVFRHRCTRPEAGGKGTGTSENAGGVRRRDPERDWPGGYRRPERLDGGYAYRAAGVHGQPECVQDGGRDTAPNNRLAGLKRPAHRRGRACISRAPSAPGQLYSGCMPISPDNDLLAAALVGYQRKLTEIDVCIAGLRERIAAHSPASSAKPTAAPAKKKRRLSPEGRARIIAATKKRWAGVRKAKAAAMR